MKARIFLVKIVNRSVMKIHKMLISCIKLDHALYSINYGITYNMAYPGHPLLTRVYDTLCSLAIIVSIPDSWELGYRWLCAYLYLFMDGKIILWCL